MDIIKNNLYIVRYRLNGVIIHKEFNSEYEAYSFYQSLKEYSFKGMILESTRKFVTPLLFEGSGSGG